MNYYDSDPVIQISNAELINFAHKEYSTEKLRERIINFLQISESLSDKKSAQLGAYFLHLTEDENIDLSTLDRSRLTSYKGNEKHRELVTQLLMSVRLFDQLRWDLPADYIIVEPTNDKFCDFLLRVEAVRRCNKSQTKDLLEAVLVGGRVGLWRSKNKLSFLEMNKEVHLFDEQPSILSSNQ